MGLTPGLEISSEYFLATTSLLRTLWDPPKVMTVTNWYYFFPFSDFKMIERVRDYVCCICERERVCVERVCVCVREREREIMCAVYVRESVWSVCVWERERRECKCVECVCVWSVWESWRERRKCNVCLWVGERESMYMCVCVWKRKSEIELFYFFSILTHVLQM